MTALNVNAHANPTAKPQPSSANGRRHPNFAARVRPSATPIRVGSTKYAIYPGGTAAGRPPQVMLNGHQDGIRGMNGGNCAYIAQSYGASSQENEIAEIQTSRSGSRRRRRIVRYKPATTKTVPPM